MAISHKDHDHPNTPAARATCRKATAKIEEGTTARHSDVLRDVLKPAQVTVVPRTRGDGGVVKGMVAAKPTSIANDIQFQHGRKDVKRPNSLIKNVSDLADMPKMLAYAVRLGWDQDWDVKVGDRFREDEKRIEVHGDKGIVSLVWRDKRPDGIWKIWVRNFDSSKQYTVESAQEAIEIMRFDSDRWDQYGNLKTA